MITIQFEDRKALETIIYNSSTPEIAVDVMLGLRSAENGEPIPSPNSEPNPGDDGA